MNISRVDRGWASLAASYLLVDFDGVLHPLGGEPFCRMPLLVRLLEEMPDVRVVVSSSWRLQYDLDALRLLMFGTADHPLAGRVVDTLPFFADFPKPEESAFRMREALAWGALTGVERWVAVDDKEAVWFRSPGDVEAHQEAGRHVVLCDGETGLTGDVIDEVKRLLRLDQSVGSDCSMSSGPTLPIQLSPTPAAGSQKEGSAPCIQNIKNS